MNKTRYKVLDTSIIMDGPESFIDAFTPKEGTTYCIIPIDVLSELDSHKTSRFPDRARSSRRALRTLSERGNLYEGIEVNTGVDGRAIFVSDLFDEFKEYSRQEQFDKQTTSRADSRLIDLTEQLTRNKQGAEVELISNDVSLRLIAQAQGLIANPWQDYEVIKSMDELYNGWRDIRGLPKKLYGHLHKENAISLEDMQGLMEDGQLLEDLIKNPRPNEYFIATNNLNDIDKAVLRWDARQECFLKLNGYIKRGNKKIAARTVRQACMMDALRQEDITLVTALGSAGTGKTFLAIEAGMELCAFNVENGFQTESKLKEGLKKLHKGEELEQMIITRPLGIDEDDNLGYLPGDEGAKFGPYAQPIKQNVRAICYSHGLETHAANSLWDMLRSEKEGDAQLALLPFQHMRGQTLMRSFIVADEMQNAKQEKAITLISRAEGISRVVITGDPKQIDPPYLSSANNALVLANQAHEWDDTAASIVFEPEDVVRSKRAARSVKLLEKMMKK